MLSFPRIVRSRRATSGADDHEKYYTPEQLEQAVVTHGRSLAYLSPIDDSTFKGSKLWFMSVDGGTPTPMVVGHLSWPRWSPDGTRISYADAGNIYVLNITRVRPR